MLYALNEPGIGFEIDEQRILAKLVQRVTEQLMDLGVLVTPLHFKPHQCSTELECYGWRRYRQSTNDDQLEITIIKVDKTAEFGVGFLAQFGRCWSDATEAMSIEQRNAHCAQYGHGFKHYTKEDTSIDLLKTDALLYMRKSQLPNDLLVIKHQEEPPVI